MTTRVRRHGWGMPAAAALLGLLGGTALGADFVFTVPVELDKIPEPASVLVFCNVYNANGEAIGGGNQGAQVNRNTGQARRDVSVSVDVRPPHSPFSARTYRCNLTMTIPGATPKWGEPSPTSEVAEFRPRPGTEFVGEVRGDLPAVLTPRALDPKLPRVPGTR